MHTAVRVSYAMAQDAEMPEILGLLHGKYATPHFGVWVLVAVSAIIGCVGVVSVSNLTAITLASNTGTFALYLLICVWTIVAFRGRGEFSGVKHMLIPVLGFLGNALMLAVIFGLGLTSDTSGALFQQTILAVGIAVGWAVVSGVYFVFNSRATGRPIAGVPQPRAAVA